MPRAGGRRIEARIGAAAGRRWPAGAAIALSLALAAHLVFVVTGFLLPVPRTDHFGALGFLLNSLDQGQSLARILWSQHNEHRLVIARLVDLAVIRWGHGDFRFVVYVSVGLAAATGGWAWWILARQLRESHPLRVWWILIGMTVLALSPAQMENWIDPFQLQIYIPILAGLCGYVLLGAAPLTWLRAGLAVLCGVAATASVSGGLLFWPIALLPLWANTERARRIPVLGGWIALSALVWGGYLWNFSHPSGHPSVLALLDDPWATLQFFLVLIGNPLGAFVRPQDPLSYAVVPAFGAAGVILFAWMSLRARRRLLHNPQWTILLAFAAQAAGNAVAITVGRVGFGLIAAFPTRYITPHWPFWAGTLALLSLEDAQPLGGSTQEPRRGLGARFPLSQAAWSVVIVIGLATLNTHVQRWRPFIRDVRAAVAELPDVCQGNAEVIGHVAPADLVAEALLALVRHGLMSFAPEAVAIGLLERQEKPPGAVESARLEPEPRSETSGRCWRISGHLPPRAEPASEVLLVDGNRVLKRGWVGLLRPRAGPDYDADPHPESGWTLYIGTARLPAGLDRLDVYAVQRAGPLRWIGAANLRLSAGP